MKSILILILLITVAHVYSEDISICQEGWAESQKGNYKKALELFKKCIATGNLSKGSLARTYRNIGITLKRDGQFKEAIKYYNKALELKPSDPWDDYVNRGNAWSELGDYKKALADYKLALKKKPNYNEVYYNRGIVFEKQDKKEKAKKEFELAYEHGLRSQLLQDRLLAYGIIKKPTKLKLPKPPKGYAWEECPKIKGAFLKPDKWFFKSVLQNETHSYFITKEEIKDNKQFTTGMSIFVIKDIPKLKSTTPLEFGKLVYESAKKSQTISKHWEKDMGPFKSLGYIYSKGEKAEKLTVHNLLIANNKTGTLYMVIFEAPASEWEETWKLAEPMLKYLYIDGDI